jgi:hypothetical protein
MKSKQSHEYLMRSSDAAAAWQKLGDLFVDVLAHSGYGEIRIDVRWLSKGRKEVVLSSGKQYRFVIADLPPNTEAAADAELKTK